MVENLPANAGDLGLIPELERSPGEGNGNALWYSCLGNLMERGTSWSMGLQRVRHDFVTKQDRPQGGKRERSPWGGGFSQRVMVSNKDKPSTPSVTWRQ